eukprot:PITA_35218
MDKVVEEYRDIFASPTRVPLHYQVKHSIDLTLGTPLPNGPIYQCYVLENDEIKRQIQELLQKRHIKPSSSPCGSSIVLFKGAKYLRKIELKLGYHHVLIEPSNVWKTTFKSKESLVKWLVMPFGLMNAPATFMRLIDDILQPFTNAFMVLYLDDIWIFNKSLEDHLHHI